MIKFRHGSLSYELLKAIGDATGFFSWPLEYSYSWRLEQIYGSKKKLYNNLWRMQRTGLVKAAEKNGKKFFRLTAKGELEILLKKAVAGRGNKKAWDRKWRMISFDIPEKARDKRNQLRDLLKRNDFKKLQASVFISPYPLNRESVSYLKQTRLIEYIRFAKIEEMDDDKSLRKSFGLK